jgi:type II secretory pathway component PulF
MAKQCSHGRLGDSELAGVARSLATLMAAGWPHEKILPAMAERTSQKQVRDALVQISKKTDNAHSLATTFSQWEELFGSLFCEMLRTGETRGTLPATLLRLAEFYEQQRYLTKTVVQKIRQPLLVIAVSIGAIVAVAAYLVSCASTTITVSSNRYVILTEIISYLHSRSALMLLSAFTLIVLVLSTGLLNTVRLRPFEKIGWGIPLLGSWVRKARLQRFFLSIATALMGGMTLEPSIKYAIMQSNSGLIRQAIISGNSGIPQRLDGLMALLESKKLISPLIKETLKDAGSLVEAGDLLKKIGRFYQESIISSVSAVVIILEPLIIAVTGLLALSLLLALYLPFI